MPITVCARLDKHDPTHTEQQPLKHMSVEYLQPGPEGVCGSYIVPINEKNVRIQKLFFVPSSQILHKADN